MSVVSLCRCKKQFHRLASILNGQAMSLKYTTSLHCIQLHYTTTTIDAIDSVANNMIKRNIERLQVGYKPFIQNFSLDFEDCYSNTSNLSTMTVNNIETLFMDTLKKQDHKKIEQLLKQCEAMKKLVTKTVLYKLYQTYSSSGNVNMVMAIQRYCVTMYPKLYVQNGQYLHYLARAQCMKGNSEQGLTLLRQCYDKNENLRGLYRYILRDLINDSVQNKSEASLVIFKRFILEFSVVWKEHYPLVCFWHICWTSTWFSDQMMADELLELSESLRIIIKERAPALCLNVLRNEYNEDAVLRLLQSLLKYGMLLEYTKVLQILFGYKLRNRDVRGCREIILNCEALGIPLSSEQQGKYIQMIITQSEDRIQPTKYFKLKF